MTLMPRRLLMSESCYDTEYIVLHQMFHNFEYLLGSNKLPKVHLCTRFVNKDVLKIFSKFTSVGVLFI